MGGDGFSGPNRAGRRQPPAVSISVRHPVIHDEGLIALVSFGYAKNEGNQRGPPASNRLY
jgi:hypothetical protein